MKWRTSSATVGLHEINFRSSRVPIGCSCNQSLSWQTIFISLPRLSLGKRKEMFAKNKKRYLYIFSLSEQGPPVISHQSREQGAKSNIFTSPWSACDSCLLALEVKWGSEAIRRERVGVPLRTRCDFIKSTWSWVLRMASQRLSTHPLEPFISNADFFFIHVLTADTVPYAPTFPVQMNKWFRKYTEMF